MCLAAISLGPTFVDLLRVPARVSRVDEDLEETKQQLVLVCQALGGARKDIGGMSCHRRHHNVGGQSSPAPAFRDVPDQPSAAPPPWVAKARTGHGDAAEQGKRNTPAASAAVTTKAPNIIASLDPEVQREPGEEGRRPTSAQSDDAVGNTPVGDGADSSPSTNTAAAAAAVSIVNYSSRTGSLPYLDQGNATTKMPKAFRAVMEGSTPDDGSVLRNRSGAMAKRSGDDSSTRVDSLGAQVADDRSGAAARGVSEIEGDTASTLTASTDTSRGTGSAPILPGGRQPDVEPRGRREHQVETVVEGVTPETARENVLEIAGCVSPIGPVAVPDTVSALDSDDGKSARVALAESEAEIIKEAAVVAEGLSESSGEETHGKTTPPTPASVTVPAVPVPDFGANEKAIARLAPNTDTGGELAEPATDADPTEVFEPATQVENDSASPAEQHTLPKGEGTAARTPPVGEDGRYSPLETVIEGSSASLPPAVVATAVPHSISPSVVELPRTFKRDNAEGGEENEFAGFVEGVSEQGGAGSVAPTSTAGLASPRCLSGDGAARTAPSETAEGVVEQAVAKDGGAASEIDRGVRLSDSETNGAALLRSKHAQEVAKEAAALGSSEERAPAIISTCTGGENVELVSPPTGLEKSAVVEEIKGSHSTSTASETGTVMRAGAGDEHASRPVTRRLKGHKGRLPAATEAEKQAFTRAKGHNGHSTNPATASGSRFPSLPASGFITSRLRRPGAGNKRLPTVSRMSKPVVSSEGIAADAEASEVLGRLNGVLEEGQGASTSPSAAAGEVDVAAGEEDVAAGRGHAHSSIAGASPSGKLSRRRSSDALFGLRRLSSVHTTRQREQPQQQQTAPDLPQRAPDPVRAATARATEGGESERRESRARSRSSSPESQGGEVASGDSPRGEGGERVQPGGGIGAAARSMMASPGRAGDESDRPDSPPSSPEARGGPGRKERRRGVGGYAHGVPLQAEKGGGREAAARGREVGRIQADSPSSSPDSTNQRLEDGVEARTGEVEEASLPPSLGGSGAKAREENVNVNTAANVALDKEGRTPKSTSSSSESVAHQGERRQQQHSRHDDDEQDQSAASSAPEPGGIDERAQFEVDNTPLSAGEEMAPAAVRTKHKRGRSSGLLSSMRGAVAKTNVSKKSINGRVRSDSPQARG